MTHPSFPVEIEQTCSDNYSWQKNALKELMPEVFTDGGKIDFDRLRLTLGDAVESGREGYGLNWAGKTDCLRTLQHPNSGTLVPRLERSVNFDTAQNVIIEGDNLEVLKLLQKSYLGKIKMIYIDPPYNTGQDFIYNDKFADSLETYLTYTGQTDALGRRFSTKPETDGRFHSRWLSMMYPRLALARNLLRHDGVIFISIDEVEHPRLRMIADELFGEENHIADLVWQNKKGGGNDAKHIAVEHEYVVMYAKCESALHELFEPFKPTYLDRYKHVDENGRFFWDNFKRKASRQFYPITCPDGSVLQFDEDGHPISWLRSELRFHTDLKTGEARIVRSRNRWIVQFKQRLPKGKKPRSLWLEHSVLDNIATTGNGAAELKSLFGKKVFDNPKPTQLIRYLCSFVLGPEDCVLDFFAGSGSTGQAVLDLNREDGGNRRFILVQLPEPASHIPNLTIADLCEERIRRVFQRHNTDATAPLPQNLDQPGFRSFVLSSRRLKTWCLDSKLTCEELASQLQAYCSRLSAHDHTDQIVFELLLNAGFELSAKVTPFMIEGITIYSVHDSSLLICLAESITTALIDQVLAMQPKQVICLDSGFRNNDSLRLNTIANFKSNDILFSAV